MPALGRQGTTCLLRAHQGANRAKPEEQVTAVLAGALQTCLALRKELLRELKVPETGWVEVDTEFGTGDGGDRIDLQMRILDPKRGRLRRRVWIEVKVNSQLDRGGPWRQPQLVRYQEALNEHDRERRDLRKSRLAVLVRRADELEWSQINRTGAGVVYWQALADIADKCGRELAGAGVGEEWHEIARRPDAPLELANLDTLVWFLENAEAKTKDNERVPIVGISAASPWTAKHAREYTAAYQALNALCSLGKRMGMELEKKNRLTEALETDSGLDDEAFDFLTYRSRADLVRKRGWWLGKGHMEFWLMPVDHELDEIIPGPHIWAGVTFDEPLRTRQEWRAHAEREGFGLDENEDGRLWSLGVRILLKEALGTSKRPGEQAQDLAEWVDDKLSKLEALRPPGSRLQSLSAER